MSSFRLQFHHTFFFIILSLFTGSPVNADSFYANEAAQRTRAEGFALQPESAVFVRQSKRVSLWQAERLIKDLKEDQELFAQLQSFSGLTPMEQVPVLKAVFKVEVRSMGIKAPNLVIDLNYPRAAFFEFDVNSTNPGTVIINPSKSYADNPLMSLSLLIHETRHSLQLQMAQAGKTQGMRGPMARAYFNAFQAQRELSGKLSFCDFLTLNNEYEAFLFGNYVIHKLYDARVDMISMGTFASQFDREGNLKIDLAHLHARPAKNVLEEFNLRQQEQARLLGL